MSGLTIRIVGFGLAGLVLLTLGIRFAFARMLSTGGMPANAVQKTVRSADGTLIAWEQTGSGPVLILVSAALVDRDGTRPLARELASTFTVVNYDRRGRGQSANASTYRTDLEVEDIEALAATFHQPVLLFGSSSGAVLALDAASRMQSRVNKVFLYEPPFVVDASHPPVSESLGQEVAAAVAANNRDEAVGLFFRKAMGIPGPGVTLMRLLMPAWKDMAAIAHTVPYDLMILAGTQSGKPLPAGRWSPTTSPVLVAVGSKSEPFFHSGAKALKQSVPVAEYRSLEGLDHGSVLMKPQDTAAAVREYFGQSDSVEHQ